jgi:hypothetical protein
MNTKSNKSTLDTALSGISKQFSKKIANIYLELKKRHSVSHYSHDYDSFGLSVGKFGETILRCLQHHLTSQFIPFGTHISNFQDECQKLSALPRTSGNESLRIIIPRALAFLYTLRGKRGIGHVGGDVDANFIDSSTMGKICDWIMCELIRIFHNLSLEEAQSLIDSISTRTVPDIWEANGKKRVLRSDLNYSQKTLLLAYSESRKSVSARDLFNWSKYSDYSTYVKTILKPLHREDLIEFDEVSDEVVISPLGIREVETSILNRGKI